MQEKLPPILTSMFLTYKYRDYKDPKARVARLLKQGHLIRIKRGLYVNAMDLRNENMLGKIANALYGPSYVSFEYALRIHGLIPEDVRNVGSATMNKRRGKVFQGSGTATHAPPTGPLPK